MSFSTIRLSSVRLLFAACGAALGAFALAYYPENAPPIIDSVVPVALAWYIAVGVAALLGMSGLDQPWRLLGVTAVVPLSILSVLCVRDGLTFGAVNARLGIELVATAAVCAARFGGSAGNANRSRIAAAFGGWMGVVVVTTAGTAVAVPIVRAERIHQWLSTQVPIQSDALRAEGRVRVVVFTDYQCPVCRLRHQDFDPVIAEMRRKYPGRIEFVTRDFPLSEACNSGLRANLHPLACDEAVAVRTASSEARPQLVEDLFARQDGVSPEVLELVLANAGLLSRYRSSTRNSRNWYSRMSRSAHLWVSREHRHTSLTESWCKAGIHACWRRSSSTV